MEFLEAYQRMEDLWAHRTGGKGRVATYIAEMERRPDGAYCVENWEEDLQHLQHYRRVRNKMAHDPQCPEGKACTREDIRWLEDFYFRLLSRDDPMTLYRRVTQLRHPTIPKDKRPFPWGVCFWLGLALVSLLILILVLFR